MGWRLQVPQGEGGRVIEFFVIMAGIIGVVLFVWGIVNLNLPSILVGTVVEIIVLWLVYPR